MQNWSETLLSQYGASPTLTALIELLNEAVDPSIDLQNVYTNLFDVESAVGQGLDNWGQIVNVSRYLTVPAPGNFLGFSEAHVAGDALDTLGSAPMYPGELTTMNLRLTDAVYRTLILVKAAANITSLTADSLNTLLNVLLGLSKTSPNRVFVQDTGGMQQRYVLEFAPTPYQLAVLLNSAIMPRGAGVLLSVLTVFPQTFGFNESLSNTAFPDGTFLPNSGLQNAS